MRMSSTSSSTLVLDKRNLLLRKVQQIDRLGFWLSVIALVLKNDSRRIVAQKEFLEFHLKFIFTLNNFCKLYGVWGLGFGVWGLGFGVWEIGRAHV